MDQTLIYLLFLTIVAMVLLLVGLLFLYLRTVTKFAEFRQAEAKRLEEPEKLIREAQAKAAKLLTEAQSVLEASHKESSKNIARADEFLSAHYNDLNKSLNVAHQSYLEKYGITLTSLQTESVKLLQNVPKDISQAFAAEVQKVRTSLEAKMNEAQTDARNLVISAYKKAEAEVAEYKAARLSQVEESLVYILENIARKVLIKEISHDEHEKLVLKALEEAKRQGIFKAESNSGQKSANNSKFSN